MRYMLILLLLSVSLNGQYLLAAQQQKVDKSVTKANEVSSSAAPKESGNSIQVQSIEDQEIFNIENLYKNIPKEVSPPPKITPKEMMTPQEQKTQLEIKNNVDVQKGKVKSLTDLNKLAPFSDVSVIQKKFLPKTDRFQLYLAGGLMTNSPWFNNLGAKIGLGYHFIESLAVETSVTVLSGAESQSAKEIRSNNNLEPDKFVFTKNSILIDLAWSPIYGKITNIDQVIIPFDMYFSIGGGVSGTNAEEKSVSTIHLATGQVFALSKSMAFRWDYSWSIYQATPITDTASTGGPAKGNYNDLILTAGVSFFFPEASYR